MPTAACYARYSSDLQRATSIEDQLRVARNYAAEHGWTVDEGRIYSDAGISGSSIEGRPGLQALLAAAAQRPLPFQVLLVDDSSRIARDIADAIRTMQTLKFFGVRVIYISQHIDSASEQAETLVAVHGMVDSLYLKEAAKKIKRGLAGQHHRGFATGAITFGYRSVPVPDPSGKTDANGHALLLGKRVEVNQSQAPIVLEIFEMYSAGTGVETIVARLNKAGRQGPRGMRWRVGTVRTLLRNEKYRGLLIWGKQTADRRPGTRRILMRDVPRDQWHVQERPELRIVSDDLWARVQERRAEVRTAFGLKDGRTLAVGRNAALHSTHLFSGFLRCGGCGGAITVVSGGYGSPRYGCARSWKNGHAVCGNRITIRAKIADAHLVAGLRAELLRPETVHYVTAALTKELNLVINERPKAKRAIEDSLKDARRRLANLVLAVEDGSGSTALLEAMKAREADVRRLEGTLSALDEPLERKLAVMPTWVRQQLEDTAGLLSEAPERAKAEFKRLGVAFTLHPVYSDVGRPFLRAEGTSDFAHVISGQYLPSSTTDATNLRSKQ
jgi:site-specific DNA recombinase